jgi:hypothetical protein
MAMTKSYSHRNLLKYMRPLQKLRSQVKLRLKQSMYQSPIANLQPYRNSIRPINIPNSHGKTIPTKIKLDNQAIPRLFPQQMNLAQRNVLSWKLSEIMVLRR